MLAHKEQLVSSDVMHFLKKTFRWIIQQRSGWREGSASTASLEKWRKFPVYFMICISDPKGPQAQRVSTRSCSGLCARGQDPPRASPPSSPPPVAGSVPALPSRSAAALLALGCPSALPIPSTSLGAAAPQPPLHCGNELSFAHGRSQLDHCNDLSLRMASVT